MNGQEIWKNNKNENLSVDSKDFKKYTKIKNKKYIHWHFGSEF